MKSQNLYSTRVCFPARVDPRGWKSPMNTVWKRAVLIQLVSRAPHWKSESVDTTETGSRYRDRHDRDPVIFPVYPAGLSFIYMYILVTRWKPIGTSPCHSKTNSTNGMHLLRRSYVRLIRTWTPFLWKKIFFLYFAILLRAQLAISRIFSAYETGKDAVNIFKSYQTMVWSIQRNPIVQRTVKHSIKVQSLGLL